MAVFKDYPFWLWLDIETTGSDRNKHSVLEVAWVITDSELEVLDEASYLIKPDESVDMRVVNTTVGKMHTNNGLWNEWLSTGEKYSLGRVKRLLTDKLSELGKKPKERVLLCGSGAGRFDKPFLDTKCPGFCSEMTYFDLDVSVLRRFFDWDTGFKGKSHRALGDCKVAIDEFKFYLMLKEKANAA